MFLVGTAVAWEAPTNSPSPNVDRVGRLGSIDGSTPVDLKAVVQVDLTRSLRRGGRDRLRRNAYFNIHGAPRDFERGEWDYLVGDLRASVGRSIGSISSFFSKQQDDPQRTGRAGSERLARVAEGLTPNPHPRRSIHGTSTQVVYSAHPHVYYRKKAEAENGTRRFIPASHRESANILVAFFRQLDHQQETYFEVANEGNVHTRELGTNFQDMCDLHRVVARRLREECPNVRVGGPASAWPAFEVKNFRIWKEQMGLFIDRVGRDMDFLSVHLYTTHWDDKTNHRFGANVDAILDLMENQSLLSTGEVKPLLISECGTGFRKGEQIMGEYSPQRDWLILQGANHILFDLMRRDDRIIKSIPFIVAKARWYHAPHPYPWVLFHEKGGRWEYTHLVKWFQFWKDVQGQFLPVQSPAVNIQAQAMMDGRTIFVCLDNLESREVDTTIAMDGVEQLAVEHVSISRLYCEDRAPRLIQNQRLSAADWQHVRLRPDEAVIFRIALAEAPKQYSTLLEATHYGDRTLVPITGKPAVFHVASPGARAESATLRVSAGRNKKLTSLPQVTVNGHPMDVPAKMRGQGGTVNNDCLAARYIDVPVELLRDRNRVSVTYPEPGGHVSTVVLSTRIDFMP